MNGGGIGWNGLPETGRRSSGPGGGCHPAAACEGKVEPGCSLTPPASSSWLWLLPVPDTAGGWMNENQRAPRPTAGGAEADLRQ